MILSKKMDSYLDITNCIISFITLRDLLSLLQLSKSYNKYMKKVNIYLKLEKYHKKHILITIDNVCKEGDLELLVFLSNKDNNDVYKRFNSYYKNLFHNYVPRSLGFITVGGHIIYSEKAIKYAAENGRLDIIQWFNKFYHFKYSNQAFVTALKNNHKHIVDWFVNSDYVFDYNIVLSPVIQYGNIELIDWIIKKYSFLKHLSYIVDIAAMYGKISVIEYFDSNYVFEYSYSAVDHACLNGHLNVLEWFHNSKYELKYTYHAIDNATLTGHIDILIWFYTHGYRLAYYNALNYAVVYEHLNILQWFDSHISINYYDELLYRAVIMGYFDIMLWILKNKFNKNINTPANIKVYTKCINFATNYNHFDIIKWFDQSLYIFECEDAIKIAYKRKNKNLIKWFNQSRYRPKSIKDRIFNDIYYNIISSFWKN